MQMPSLRDGFIRAAKETACICFSAITRGKKANQFQVLMLL